MANEGHVITASAPVRMCDCGGWTDTWFAGHGRVFHMAIEPRVHVRVEASARRESAAPAVIHADNYGDAYGFVPGRRPWGPHPLIEAAIESVGVPDDLCIDLSVHSDMPPGASTGTSGAVVVAIVGALQSLQGIKVDPGTVARAAHAVETERLGQQSGVQDQWAAACGGINDVEISRYPNATVTRIAVPDGWRDTLESQLLLVYLGRSHSSSAVHEAVIHDVLDAGPARAVLDDLRAAAADARDAVMACDLTALGGAMRDNTAAQRRLHPSLVGPDAERVIIVAREHGALGWKVNGAGGEGGSVTVLCDPHRGTRIRIEAAVDGQCPSCRVIPIRLASTGLMVEARSSRLL
jgi:D-glycero-alpha-D-manno-heptose-7-phosphate kinase